MGFSAARQKNPRLRELLASAPASCPRITPAVCARLSSCSSSHMHGHPRTPEHPQMAQTPAHPDKQLAHGAMAGRTGIAHDGSAATLKSSSPASSSRLFPPRWPSCRERSCPEWQTARRLIQLVINFPGPGKTFLRPSRAAGRPSAFVPDPRRACMPALCRASPATSWRLRGLQPTASCPAMLVAAPAAV